MTVKRCACARACVCVRHHVTSCRWRQVPRSKLLKLLEQQIFDQMSYPSFNQHQHSSKEWKHSVVSEIIHLSLSPSATAAAAAVAAVWLDVGVKCAAPFTSLWWSNCCGMLQLLASSDYIQNQSVMNSAHGQSLLADKSIISNFIERFASNVIFM